MLDLETWGTKPGCAIRSIGAVMFDEDGLGREFYINVDDASCASLGLTKDKSTVDWWAQQSAAAQAALVFDPMPLGEALVSFLAFWKSTNAKYIWGYGATFDPPILEACLDAVGLDAPWDFWNVRCSRTALAMANRRPKREVGTHHNALDDAKAQAVALIAALKFKQFNLG